MNIEMILVGLILFSGMAVAGVKIWVDKHKKEEENVLDSNILSLIIYSLKLSDVSINI